MSSMPSVTRAPPRLNTIHSRNTRVMNPESADPTKNRRFRVAADIQPASVCATACASTPLSPGIRAKGPDSHHGGSRREPAPSCWSSQAPDVSGQAVGGRPRLGKGPAFFGIRPASSRARRSSISMWALRLRNSSAAHWARASWTVGSIRSSTCLRSLTDQE